MTKAENRSKSSWLSVKTTEYAGPMIPIRGGGFQPGEWKTMVVIAAESSNNAQLPEQVGDLSNVFTNDLIDEINDFDKAAVVKQASDFKL